MSRNLDGGATAPAPEREAAGASLDSVVKTTVFLRDLDDFAAMNEVYARNIGDGPPARSTVEVGRLPSGALVEIEAIALV